MSNNIITMRNHLVDAMCKGIKRKGERNVSKWKGMAELISVIADTDTDFEYGAAWFIAKAETADWKQEQAAHKTTQPA